MSSKDKTPESESEFAEAMRAQGVKPFTKATGALPAQPVMAVVNKNKGASVALRRRREQAEAESPVNAALGDTLRDWLGPHDIVEFKRSGLQHGTFKDFKQGRIRPSATLDLHRHTVKEARQYLIAFVRDCQREGVRCALVMHGKGFHSRPSQEELHSGKAVARIKSFVVHWLQQMPNVLAMSSAQAKDGGTGAVYVLFTSREGAGKLPPLR